MLLKEEYVHIGLDCDNWDQTIRTMAKVLYDHGVVKDSYVGAALDREGKWPTGLPTTAFDIAMPHAEAENSNSAALSVAILKHPVDWQQMGDISTTLHAEMVFMLAVNDPNGHMKLLKNLMFVFQDDELLKKLRVMTDKKQIVDTLNEVLEKQI